MHLDLVPLAYISWSIDGPSKFYIKSRIKMFFSAKVIAVTAKPSIVIVNVIYFSSML